MELRPCHVTKWILYAKSSKQKLLGNWLLTKKHAAVHGHRLLTLISLISPYCIVSYCMFMRLAHPGYFATTSSLVFV